MPLHRYDSFMALNLCANAWAICRGILVESRMQSRVSAIVPIVDDVNAKATGSARVERAASVLGAGLERILLVFTREARG